MKKILILGGGAIGRGFVPWVFPPDKFEYVFDDVNEHLLNKLYKRKQYTTWCTKNGHYEPLTVKLNGRIPRDINFVVIAVGARNFLGLSERFMRTETPIICCENDSRLAPKMREITGNQNIFFAIPDVITSNTASDKLLEVDPLSIITEDGVMYIEEGARQFCDGGNAVFLNREEMHREWMAKLYLHNTPHCIAAYLGQRYGKKYVHEAMGVKEVSDIIYGVILETAAMVHKVYGLDEEFVRQYSIKELGRFANPLLCDPISRVAREPMRKLALGERLLGAAMLCDQCGIPPRNITQGVKAAIEYCDPKDPDYRIMKLFNQLEVEDFVQAILHLRPAEKYYSMLVEALND